MNSFQNKAINNKIKDRQAKTDRQEKTDKQTKKQIKQTNKAYIFLHCTYE